jgi:hypothetical protein
MTAPASNITEERAARRFHQMRRAERHLAAVDDRIALTKLELKTLKEERDGYVGELRAAARDEGDLPLFDWDEG